MLVVTQRTLLGGGGGGGCVATLPSTILAITFKQVKRILLYAD